MQVLKPFVPLFSAIIAFCAFFSLQFGIIYYTVDAKINPISKRIENLEVGQANLEGGQAKLEAGQAKLEKDIAEIKKLLKK